ncbi:Hypothetical_protein [Hexamita inflata]|uniref:Hypothetical_protein n=1 Tax=Hexamita inflata TaxID=28002 RepID=A0ABP1HBQ0_9EUKA
MFIFSFITALKNSSGLFIILLINILNKIRCWFPENNCKQLIRASTQQTVHCEVKQLTLEFIVSQYSALQTAIIYSNVISASSFPFQTTNAMKANAISVKLVKSQCRSNAFQQI